MAILHPELIVKEVMGWICSGCQNISLEHRKTRPFVCPFCGSNSWRGSVHVAKVTEIALSQTDLYNSRLNRENHIYSQPKHARCDGVQCPGCIEGIFTKIPCTVCGKCYVHCG